MRRFVDLSARTTSLHCNGMFYSTRRAVPFYSGDALYIRGTTLNQVLWGTNIEAHDILHGKLGSQDYDGYTLACNRSVRLILLSTKLFLFADHRLH